MPATQGQRRSRPSLPSALALALFAAVLDTSTVSVAADVAGASLAVAECAVGTWRIPGEAGPVASPVAAAATSKVVLLGEQHDDADHHRWQLQVLSELHGRRPHLVIGFEMFPVSAQPVLDLWVAGELGEAAFLDAVGWREVWGFDADLYWPLLHFARLNRVPMLALNLPRGVSRQVARGGWSALPEAERVRLGTAAPPVAAYRDELREVFDGHPAGTFDNFVDAQLAWDRTLAVVLAEAAGRPDRPLVVGILGAGHVENGWGVPHQLADLGVSAVTSFLPVSPRTCDELAAGLADTVFVIEPRP